MNLTWHIVRKDLRRLAAPVAAWTAFTVVTMVWLGTSHMSEEVVRANEHYRWINSLGGFSTWVTGMLIVTTALFAGYLVIEDTIPGTTSFWLTRPISRRRMLAAKLVAAAVLFVAAPVVALALWWLASGFSMGEMAMAAFEFALWQTVIVLVSFALASLSNSLARFFFAACGLAVTYVLILNVASSVWRLPMAQNITNARILLTFALPVLFMSGVMVFQFLTRRSSAGWCAVGVGMAAVLTSGVAWPTAVPMPWRARTNQRATEASGDIASDRLAVQKLARQQDHSVPPVLWLRVGALAHAGNFLAPETGKLSLRLADNRRIALALRPDARWGEAAAKRLAGVVGGQSDLDWSMTGESLSHGGDWLAADEALEVTGELQFAALNGRVLAELPLRAGAEARSGSSLTRIAGLSGDAETQRPSIAVEERDSVFIADVGLNAGRDLRRSDRSRRDSYLLVNRALGLVQGLQVTEIGSTNMGSLLVSVRQLVFSYPMREVGGTREEIPNWRDGAVLIKVRFELEQRVMREVKSEHVPFVTEETK